MSELTIQQKEIIKELDSLGYQFEGTSDMGFLRWKAKDMVSLADDPYGHDSFGFDGWERVQEFLNDVHELQQQFTLAQLNARLNGDFSQIEYGDYNTADIKIAAVNHPEHGCRQEKTEVRNKSKTL